MDRGFSILMTKLLKMLTRKHSPVTTTTVPVNLWMPHAATISLIRLTVHAQRTQKQKYRTQTTAARHAKSNNGLFSYDGGFGGSAFFLEFVLWL
jgi:hypothetical protein